MLVAKFFSSLHDEDHEVAWSENLMVYKTQQLLQEKEELGQTRFPVTHMWNCALVQLCVIFYDLQNNPYICLRL